MKHLTPKEAAQFLHDNPSALFVDCRSEMEFFFVENINELMMAVFGKMSPPHFYESLLGPPYVEDFGMKNENGF